MHSRFSVQIYCNLSQTWPHAATRPGHLACLSTHDTRPLPLPSWISTAELNMRACRAAHLQVLRVLPYSATQLCGYELFKKLLAEGDGSTPLSMQRKLTAGACAGMLSTLVRTRTCPVPTLTPPHPPTQPHVVRMWLHHLRRVVAPPPAGGRSFKADTRSTLGGQRQGPHAQCAVAAPRVVYLTTAGNSRGGSARDRRRCESAHARSTRCRSPLCFFSVLSTGTAMLCVAPRRGKDSRGTHSMLSKATLPVKHGRWPLDEGS